MEVSYSVLEVLRDQSILIVDYTILQSIAGAGTLFCKGPVGKPFKPCRLVGLCQNYQPSPSPGEKDLGRYMSQWVWLCSH